jgi:hypothetical protein
MALHPQPHLNRSHIGEVVRDAVVGDPKRPRSEIMTAESLLETVDRLFALLHAREVDYVLVGGIALLQYVEGRNTADVDVIMALAALERLPEIAVQARDADFARCRFGALQVDVLLTRNPLFAAVKRRHTAVRGFAERDIPCATVEGLLLLKLFALPSLYREGSFARVGIYENDVATLMQAYGPPMAPLLAELEAYVSPSDIAEIRTIVADLGRRIDRFEQGQA